MNIREIARLSGVSVATVSRAMNSPELVRPATLNRIREVMDEHNYSANPFARNLISNRTKSVSMLVNTLNNQFMVEAIEGAEGPLQQAGYMLNIINLSKSLETMHSLLDFFKEKRSSLFMDGMIMVGSYLYQEDYRESLRELLNCPVVAIDQGPLPDIPSVYVNEHTAMGLLADRMEVRQVKTASVISCELEYAFSQRRLELLLAETRARGITIEDKHIFSVPMELAENGYSACEHILTEGRTDCIVTSNDALAIGALRCLHDHGIRVPGDILLVSGENSKFCKMAIPSISAIQYPNHELGRIAGETLLSLIGSAEEPTTKVLLEPRLVLRESF